MAGIMKDGKPYFFGSGESYSTEEQVIGTWINGKPIYRKIIQSTTSSNGSTKYIPIGVNVDEFVSMHCLVKSNGAQYLPSGFNEACTYTASVDGYNNLGGTKANTVGIRHKSFPDLPVTIVIEYTKTTD